MQNRGMTSNTNTLQTPTRRFVLHAVYTHKTSPQDPEVLGKNNSHEALRKRNMADEARLDFEAARSHFMVILLTYTSHKTISLCMRKSLLSFFTVMFEQSQRCQRCGRVNRCFPNHCWKVNSSLASPVDCKRP